MVKKGKGKKGSKVKGPARLLVYGVVQGVGFRPTVHRIATEMGLRGYVRNNGSNVEVVVDRDHGEFVERLRAELPPLARLDRIDTGAFDEKWKWRSFVILESRQGSRDAPIPPDTALCDDCLRELWDPGDRRHLYPFINCTNCGARFSVIVDMPYDRPKTSMDEFKLCRKCMGEYKDPADRRFHAQTISCWKDGPTYTLYDRDGKAVAGGGGRRGRKGRGKGKDDAIALFCGHIDDGDLGIVKSWGGMHIACIVEGLPRMREWYKRPSKPFAIMVRDLEVARRLAYIDSDGERLLTSPERPITIVPRRAGMLEDAAPGLGNIGLFLPYSGVQHMMFRHLKADALVMTSANPAGEPMLTENEDAFGLGLDWHLLHDRRIVNRVDDTVLIPFDGRRFIIRRSRGYTPLHLPVGYDSIVLSVGPERNVNASVSKAGRLYTSQYIGHSYKYNVMRFLEHGVRYLMRLLGITDLDAVVMDLHPQYPTRAFAKAMAEETGAPIFEVQHHFAHSASLMLDNGVEEPIACLSVDGTGYGPDGTIWGGEILVNDLVDYRRVATLSGIPLLGGDAAVRDPRRLVFAIRELLGLEGHIFPVNEAEVLRKMMPTSIECTSLGRVLDALSCWLGVCCSRTYDGEAAMKLEPYLGRGEARFHFDVPVEGSGPAVIGTLDMFRQLEEHMGAQWDLDDRDRADLAYSFVLALVNRMVEVAADAAEDEGCRSIGLTGGCSYNLPIVRMVRDAVVSRGPLRVKGRPMIPAKRTRGQKAKGKKVKKGKKGGKGKKGKGRGRGKVGKKGLRLLLHDMVPNGDGGISIGQNVVVGERLRRDRK